jgi:hypothetical protein
MGSRWPGPSLDGGRHLPGAPVWLRIPAPRETVAGRPPRRLAVLPTPTYCACAALAPLRGVAAWLRAPLQCWRGLRRGGGGQAAVGLDARRGPAISNGRWREGVEAVWVEHRM